MFVIKGSVADDVAIDSIAGDRSQLAELKNVYDLSKALLPSLFSYASVQNGKYEINATFDKDWMLVHTMAANGDYWANLLVDSSNVEHILACCRMYSKGDSFEVRFLTGYDDRIMSYLSNNWSPTYANGFIFIKSVSNLLKLWLP